MHLALGEAIVPLGERFADFAVQEIVAHLDLVTIFGIAEPPAPACS
jgi:hypothetical protein